MSHSSSNQSASSSPYSSATADKEPTGNVESPAERPNPAGSRESSNNSNSVEDPGPSPGPEPLPQPGPPPPQQRSFCDRLEWIVLFLYLHLLALAVVGFYTAAVAVEQNGECDRVIGWSVIVFSVFAVVPGLLGAGTYAVRCCFGQYEFWQRAQVARFSLLAPIGLGASFMSTVAMISVLSLCPSHSLMALLVLHWVYVPIVSWLQFDFTAPPMNIETPWAELQQPGLPHYNRGWHWRVDRTYDDGCSCCSGIYREFVARATDNPDYYYYDSESHNGYDVGAGSGGGSEGSCDGGGGDGD